MNPARTFGSAFHVNYWHALWIYFIATTFGMLGAAEVFLRVRGDVFLLIVQSFTTPMTSAASSTADIEQRGPRL
jgi:Major intrinsic protein